MTSRQAKHNSKKRTELKAKGMVEVRYWTYPEHKERLKRIIERLNKQRERADD